VSGQGRFGKDRNLPGPIRAAFGRAGRAHAVIEAIDASAAKVSPAVVAARPRPKDISMDF